jgi:hypothetical protein
MMIPPDELKSKIIGFLSDIIRKGEEAEQDVALFKAQLERVKELHDESALAAFMNGSMEHLKEELKRIGESKQ